VSHIMGVPSEVKSHAIIGTLKFLRPSCRIS
jgi:hypothetical protein